MTSRFFQTVVVLLVMVLLLSACSGNNGASGNAVTADISMKAESSNQTSATPNHYLWGYYQAYADPQANKIDMVPLRSVATHWNTLNWLEKSPCKNCVKVTKIEDGSPGVKQCTVEITHPFSNKNFTGFDVRGIALFNQGYWFPVAGLSIPDHGTGNGQFGYPDGYTTLYNSTTTGSGPNGLQGFMKGKFASTTAPNSTLNGFLRFESTDPGNTRNAFYAGESISRVYPIWMPKNPFVFGYAVDACWANPTTKPVTDPMNDFPPEANCSEPWKITLNQLNIFNLTDHGGSLTLIIHVFDHQGKDSHYAPKVECPDLFDGAIVAQWASDDTDSSIYTTTISNDKLAPLGFHHFLVSVEDKDNGPSPSFLDLTAYQVDEIDVREAKGFAATWGGPDEDWGYGAATDSSGNIYVVGSYEGDTFSYIDFDPGTGVSSHGSNGKLDCFLEKFNSDGVYQWSRVWGGKEDDAALAVATWQNTVYVTGYFSDVVDFNPDTGSLFRASAGGRDGFVSGFGMDGTFLWVDTWGGSAHDEGHGVAANSIGMAMVTGYFMGDCDFDSSSGEQIHSTGIWNRGSFLSEYSMVGFWHWTISWGEGNGTTDAVANGIAVDKDDEMFITGQYGGTADLDPADGNINNSNGDQDVYLLGLTDKHLTKWVATWGGTGTDIGYGVAVDSTNKIYVSGVFQNTVDFDPTDATVDNHTSNGEYDAFLSKHDFSGIYHYTNTWGGPNTDRAMGVAVAEGIDSVYVVGDYMGTVDLNPGAGVDSHTSKGFSDFYVTRFGFDGKFNWARAFGSDDWDAGTGVASDLLGSAIFTGSFRNTVNFDPSGGTDDHTSVGNLDIFVDKIMFDGAW
jgi:hypothetical protein